MPIDAKVPSASPTLDAWKSFIGCCILCATAFGLPLLCFGVFISPLVTQFGCSVTEVNLYYTLMTGSAVVSCALGERLIMRAMRLTVLIGTLLMGIAYAALAIVPIIPMVWIAGLVAGLCYPLCSSVLTPILINQWFVARQGTYIGIAFAIAGVAGVIVSPMLASLIIAVGWQIALIATAVLVAVGGIVSAMLIHSNCTVGDGKKGELQKENANEGASLWRLSAFVPVALACLLCGFVGIMNTQVNVISQQSGFGAMQAATTLSCMSAGLLAGKIGLGVIKDVKGGLFAITTGAAIGMLGFALMTAGILQTTALWLFIGAALAGFTTCLGTVAPALLMGEAFQKNLYGRAVAMGTAFINAGMAVSAFIYSMAFDLSGSYISVIISCIIGAAAIALLCRLAISLEQE